MRLLCGWGHGPEHRAFYDGFGRLVESRTSAPGGQDVVHARHRGRRRHPARLRERVADAVEEDDLRHAGPERAQPHNLQFVRRWLINVPPRVVHRARQVFVRLAGGMLWGEVFKRIYADLQTLSCA